MCRIKRLFSVSLSLALLFTGTVTLADSELIPEDQIVADSVNYNTTTVTKGEILIDGSTYGNAYIPVQQTILYEGETAAFSEFLVSRNDTVEKDQPIMAVTIEVDEILLEEKELALTRAREDYAAELKNYDKEIVKAQKSYNEAEDDWGRKAANLSLRKLRLQREKCVYEWDRSIAEKEEELEELHANQETIYVTAPVSGTIYELSHYNEDDPVRSGAAIGVIADLTSALVKVTTSEFPYGSEVSASVSVGREQYSVPGTVVVSSASIEDSSDEFSLINLDLSSVLDLPSVGSGLIQLVSNLGRTGIKMEGNTVNLSNISVIPTKAITDEDDNDYVTILDADGDLHKRYIRTGLSNKDYTWVLLGLSEDDLIVLGK